MPAPPEPQGQILGTLITTEGYKKPFIYWPDEQRLELDHVYNPTQAAPPDDERRALEAGIRAAYEGEVSVVRIGRYHCYDCDGWFDLDGSSWSLGMCFNCSFDRSSDIADRG